MRRRSYRKVAILAIVVAGAVAIVYAQPDAARADVGADAIQAIAAAAAAVVAVNASEHTRNDDTDRERTPPPSSNGADT